MTKAQRLLRWYDRHGRDLPWRKTRHPYKILVSEIMLQQTQVPRVLFFYKKWLKKFPNWKKLAQAKHANVIRAWSGLGYNRRALTLHYIARWVVENGVPKSEREWLSLKGIGPYTAAAIASFSLHQRTLPIDTNVRRTAGRLLLSKPFPSPKDDDHLRRVVDGLLPSSGRFYDVPQALFDLATAICTKVPLCATCPMKAVCPAAKKFLSDRVRIPKATIKKSTERRHRNKKFPDRIYRGRILKLVYPQHQGLLLNVIGTQIDSTFNQKLDQDWLRAMMKRMEADGFIKIKKGRVFLA